MRPSDDDMFKSERCTPGEETCGCRPDQTCNGTLACLSDLCVDAAGSAGSTSSGGAGGSAAGSGGTPNQSVGGSEDKGGSGGTTAPGSGGDSSSGGASNNESGGGGDGGAPGGNLVENGDFSDAETLWSIEPQQANRSIADGALCFTIQAGESISLGWPNARSRAFELSGGQSYTLSYRASSSGPLAISASAKIGHAVSPYTPHFEQPITIGKSLENDSHDFDVENDDEAAGVLFSVMGAQGEGATTVCFDDVSVLASP